MNMNLINTRQMLLLCSTMMLVLALSGCATNKEALLPHGNETMLEVWQAGTVGINTLSRPAMQLMDARMVLRRPLIESECQTSITNAMSYTRTAQNEIDSQFHRLPNPDLVMYVFPHLSGTDPVPVPGYSTVFPFYQRVQYAMPGERTEPY